MTKVYIDCDDKTVFNKLDEAYKHVKIASNVECSIPDDFEYSNKLQTIVNDIKTIKTEVGGLRDWYQDSQNGFKKADENAEIRIKAISDIKIKKKNKLIK